MFVAELRAHGIQISIDGRGRCLDNAKMERFWWALKYEDIKIKEYVSLPDSFGTPISNAGLKSISELAIGKQWDIVKQGHLHQSFNKSCPV